MQRIKKISSARSIEISMTGLEMWSGSFSGRSCNFVGPYKGVALKLIKSLERQPQLLRSDMSSYHSVKR